MAMDQAHFEFVRALFQQRSGNVLGDDKAYLVETRLRGLLRDKRLKSIGELFQRLTIDVESLASDVVDALLNKETSFFRDVKQFEYLRDTAIPQLIERKANPQLSIWSAACASGQEPISIAMLLDQNLRDDLKGWSVKILATDLSTSALDQARSGRFSELETSRGLPTELRDRYFVKDGSSWVLDSRLQDRIDFRSLNLVDDWANGPHDIILLRNVMIYFDDEQKKSMLAKARRLLRPGGYLFLGASETPHFLDDQYQRVVPRGVSVYQVK